MCVCVCSVKNRLQTFGAFTGVCLQYNGRDTYAYILYIIVVREAYRRRDQNEFSTTNFQRFFVVVLNLHFLFFLLTFYKFYN